MVIDFRDSVRFFIFKFPIKFHSIFTTRSIYLHCALHIYITIHIYVTTLFTLQTLSAHLSLFPPGRNTLTTVQKYCKQRDFQRSTVFVKRMRRYTTHSKNVDFMIRVDFVSQFEFKFSLFRDVNWGVCNEQKTQQNKKILCLIIARVM